MEKELCFKQFIEHTRENIKTHAPLSKFAKDIRAELRLFKQTGKDFSFEIGKFFRSKGINLFNPEQLLTLPHPVVANYFSMGVIVLFELARAHGLPAPGAETILAPFAGASFSGSGGNDPTIKFDVDSAIIIK